MRTGLGWLVLGCLWWGGIGTLIERAAAAESTPKKIVLIAGKKSHGPEGNGIHDYPWSVKLLKTLLDNSNVREAVRVEYHLDGWPRDPATLDTADAIMVISDGRDGDLYEEAPHFANEAQLALVERQMRRGCGFLTFHFSTFAPDKYARQILDWSGGYFDWETDGQRKWYSAIKVLEDEVRLGSPEHPVSRGVRPFRLKEEFYYNLRFGEADSALRPLLVAPGLGGREELGNVVAWCRERPDGGRGFGTTCGHFYDNWRNDDFRRLILNALVWAAKAEVPVGGVQSRFYERDEIVAALEGKQGTERAEADDRPLRVLIVAGNEAHKWHNWEKTTPAIQRALEVDPRIRVDVSHDIEDLSVKKLSDYQVLVQNYVNWHDPRGISEASRAALVGFVRQGGGLVLVHFANGAFHFSLPQAGASDWPEYRKLVRRVWNHSGEGEKKGGHDAFGVFTVRPTETPSPLTKGLAPFEVTDELYFRQDGEDPIEPLLVAKSKVTGRDEPLAWVYSYGEGRVFQTLLGHSEKTYDTFEPCEMLRRAVAWTAKRAVVARPAPPGTARVSAAPPAVPAPTPALAPTRVALVEGRFGKGLDARQHGVLVAAAAAQRTAPLTVESWVKLDHKRGFQILVASEEKSSPTHWELYSYAESGVLSVYMPGRGGEYRSEVDVCDARWHHVAMVLEETRVRLYVDAKLALDRPVPRENAAREGSTVLGVGRLVEGGIGCAGTIDELRLTRGAAPPAAIPEGPPQVEANTVGLWRFDAATDGKEVPDESPAKLPARLTAAAATPAKSRANARPVVGALPDHWGVDSVGFNWTEADSRDDRWKEMELGRFQASSLPLPGSPLRKGLSIQLGSPPRAYVAFDTEFLRWRAAWTGGFLAFDPARYGLIAPPRPAGPLTYSTREGAGWGGAEGQFVGLRVHGERVVLISRLGSTEVRESPWVEEIAGRVTFIRTIELSANAPDLSLRQFDLAASETARMVERGATRVVVTPRGDGLLVAAVTGAGLAWNVASDGTGVELALAASSAPRRFQVRIAALNAADLDAWVEGVAKGGEPPSLDEFVRPGPARWTKEIVTRGERSAAPGPYVVDTLTLPHQNPYRALFFLGGHDFLPNGDVVVCTAHGDVWRVSGVNDSLERLVWRRFATGLFQPLGLKVAGGEIFVLGKDQITRLVDHNGDGEADEYVCVNNRAFTSYGGHDYVTCLEQSPDGWFYFAHATQGLVRASPDGQSFEVIATGFRNPNGMGLGPAGELTVAPQEGEWVPGSNIALVKPGGYYGYGGPRVTPERPLGYDAPLLFLPRMVDNSSGAQTWITSERWGPLRGMLHFSFGKCRLLHVVRETVEGPSIPEAPASREQGGAVAFPFVFASGAHRGRFSPHDGQLYVAGLKGWVSSAVEDGCLQRVRYTGAPVDWPEKVECRANGMAITFTRPLDRSVAEDPENYGVEQWNYRYAAAYGSADWKVTDGREEGHDRVEVLSATLLNDGRTVFLEMDPLRPANQVEVRYALRAHDGREFRDTLNYTVHAVRAERMASGRLKRPVARVTDLDPQQRARLKPGVAWEFRPLARNAAAHAGSVGRLLALAVPARGTPTSDWSAGSAFQGTGRAYLDVPVRGRYEFRVEGEGHALVRIAGQLVATMGNVALPAASRDEGGATKTTDPTKGSSAAAPAGAVVSSVTLHKGWNKIELAVMRASDEPLEVRVLWRGEGFDWEPIPSTALTHLPRASSAFVVREVEPGKLKTEETASHLEQTGWWNVGRLRCLRCHDAAPESQAAATLPRKSAGETRRERESFAAWAGREAPNLAGAGRRFETAWLREWILDPRQHRPDATMPQLIDGDTPAGRQAAADLVAYLASLSEVASATSAPTAASADSESPAAQRNAGLALYEELGCIACHRRTREAAEHEPTPPRVSLAGVGAKFRPGELAEFLRRPTAHDPWRRMPDFRLTLAEAWALEAWLRAESEPATAAPQGTESLVGNAARGAQRFAELRCDACHATGAEAAPRKAMPWAAAGANLQLDRGCLAKQASPSSKAPRWELTEEERAELSLWLLRGRTLPQHLAAMEASRFFVSELRCQACHSRDGQTSPRGLLTIEEGERGLPAETLPNLTWAGDKLRPVYLERLISGRESNARSWLKARMPGFGRYSPWLADGLSAEHGYLPKEPESLSVDADLARLGDRLTQKDALDCRQCHAVGQDKPRGDANTQIALGINFDLVRERVRPGYYSRFILNPPRFDIGTKMPVLAPDGKTTRVTHILDGDAVRQFDAIWQFIQSRPTRTDRSTP